MKKSIYLLKWAILFAIYFLSNTFLIAQVRLQNVTDSLYEPNDTALIEKILLFQRKGKEKARYITLGEKVSLRTNDNNKKKGVIEAIEPEFVQVSGETVNLSDVKNWWVKGTDSRLNKKAGRVVNVWSLVIGVLGGLLLLGGAQGGGSLGMIGGAALLSGGIIAGLNSTPTFFKRDKIKSEKWTASAAYRNGNTGAINKDSLKMPPEITFDLQAKDIEFNTPIKIVDAKITNNATNQTIEHTFLYDSLTKQAKAVDIPNQQIYTCTIKSKGYQDTTLILNVAQKKKQPVVYSLALVPKIIDYELNIGDIDGNEDLEVGEVLLINKTRNQQVVLDKKQTTGKYNVQIRLEDEYELAINNAKGYFFYNYQFKVTEDDYLAHNQDGHERNDTQVNKNGMNILLTPFKVGARIDLYGISFASGSTVLNTQSIKELDRVVNLMLQYPNARIEIGAHTDNVGDPSMNLQLSQQRANAVLNYLISKQLVANRFVCKGYGDTKPIASNDTEEGKSKNRRFELIVIGL
ncbi:MAG: OmpA family protein [Cytophagales bacterium]|nr:MAG: OmpA family protein [Cytophagales bacterium]